MKQLGAVVLQYCSTPLYGASGTLCESVPQKFDLWRFWSASRLNQSKVLYDAYHYRHKNDVSILCSLPQLHSSIEMKWYGIYPMTLLEVFYTLIRTEVGTWNSGLCWGVLPSSSTQYFVEHSRLHTGENFYFSLTFCTQHVLARLKKTMSVMWAEMVMSLTFLS